MIKNIFRVLSANGIVAIIGLVSSLFLPKILSIDDYATYQSFILYLSYIAVLHLGFPTGMNIKYAGKKLETIDKSQYKAESLIIFLILSFFTIIGIIAFFVTQQTMLLYIALMIFLYCYLGSFSLLIQAWGKFKLYAVLHILMSAVPLLIPILIYFCFNITSAKVCIWSYIIVYCITTIGCLFYNFNIIKRVPIKKILIKENWITEKIGFSFLLGNYINSLLHSIDKQFVKWFCITAEFSYYSFGLTMQSTMTIFITAIAQPLFPYMAAGKINSEEQFSIVKRLLLVLGSLSGLAYFACSLIVEYWIPQYSLSLPVIRVYFAVFPAMAVINCLFFNLYKIKKMTKRYVLDLIIMFLAGLIANYIAVKAGFGYIGVAFATTLINYFWLFYGTFVFKELKMKPIEILFIVLFVLEFIFIPTIPSIVFGALIYLLTDFLISYICFRNEILLVAKKIIHKKGLV